MKNKSQYLFTCKVSRYCLFVVYSGVCLFTWQIQTDSEVRGPPFNPRGGGRAAGDYGVFVGKLFITTRLGGALKISNFITCLHRTVIKIN